MAFYGCTVTKAGRELIAKLLATSTPLTISEVKVGSGKCPDDVFPSDLTSLVEPVATGTSTVPTYDGETLSMVLEYRSDMNGGLKKGFWLNEFSVQAENPDGDPVMLFYGTLGDYPMWVGAYKNGAIDVRRFPITITIGEGVEPVITYTPQAFMTASDVENFCENRYATKEQLSGIDGTLLKQLDIIIPTVGWTVAPTDEFDGLFVDITIEDITEDMVPLVTILPKYESEKAECGFCSATRTLDGALRIYAQKAPSAPLTASATFLASSAGSGSGGGSYKLPVATAEKLGGVKIGSGVNVQNDGTISVNSEKLADDISASNDDSDEVINKYF